MKVNFWGVRGSIPSPALNKDLRIKLRKILELFQSRRYPEAQSIDGFLNDPRLPFYITHTYGGDTSCVEVQDDDQLIILDAGSGIRNLGLDLMARKKKFNTIHIFISHTHWDHIMGFPFFVPAYIPGNKIKIYAPFSDLEARFHHQQDFRFFPVELDKMSADIEFIHFKEPMLTLGDTVVYQCKQSHPGDSFAYSLEKNNRKLIYATDVEVLGSSKDFVKQYKNFISEADILIFDSQYELYETVEKLSWGHSSYTMGVEIALMTGARNLILFHYDPNTTDEAIYKNHQTSLEYYKAIRQRNVDGALNIFSAHQGLQLEF